MKDPCSPLTGIEVGSLPFYCELPLTHRQVGRQNTAWKSFGYIPTDWKDPSGSTGLPTREASRAAEVQYSSRSASHLSIEFQYAVGDFAVRQAGIAFNKPPEDIAKYTNRSMNFLNHWDSKLTHEGFTGFLQRRYPVSLAVLPFSICTAYLLAAEWHIRV